jgi:hypothetical protein
MDRRSIWTIVGIAVAAVVTVGLVLLYVLGGGWGWMGHWGMMEGTCPWCGGTGELGPRASFAVILALAVPLGLIGLVVMGVASLMRQPPREQAGLEAVRCPACGSETQPAWKICAYCGEQLAENR